MLILICSLIFNLSPASIRLGKSSLLCLTCHVFKGAVGLHGESLPVGIQRLVAHLSAIFDGLNGHVHDRSWDISATGNLNK